MGHPQHRKKNGHGVPSDRALKEYAPKERAPDECKEPKQATFSPKDAPGKRFQKEKLLYDANVCKYQPDYLENKELSVTESEYLKALQKDNSLPELSLTRIMQGLAAKNVSIDSPFDVMDESRDLERMGAVEKTGKTEYGILKWLAGTWVSYKSDNEESMLRDEGEVARPTLGSGISTTCMPSPGVKTSGQTPGKFVFAATEYVEKLTFTTVDGGVRNRGGIAEQFVGALKYDQSIKSVSRSQDGKGLEYQGIHEENGMYLWMGKVAVHPATPQTIARDRGIYPVDKADEMDLYRPVKGSGSDERFKDEAVVEVCPPPGQGVATKYREEDVPFPLPAGSTIKVIPPKDIRPTTTFDQSCFYVPDYTIARSGIIPHGSTVSLLGGVEKVRAGRPIFWDVSANEGNPYTPNSDEHLGLHRTMGGAGLDNFYLCPERPEWVKEGNLEHQYDPQENRVYIAPILRHALYPYTVRPDLRLFSALRNEKVLDYVRIDMDTFEQSDSGARGAVINIPFINRFVPAVRTKFTLWLQCIEVEHPETGETEYVHQIQYEQQVFFEFGAGDNGGTTRWPHIQVNTLRREADIKRYWPEKVSAGKKACLGSRCK